MFDCFLYYSVHLINYIFLIYLKPLLLRPNSQQGWSSFIIVAWIQEKAGENLCSCQYISIFIPIWFNTSRIPLQKIAITMEQKRTSQTVKTRCIPHIIHLVLFLVHYSRQLLTRDPADTKPLSQPSHGFHDT